MFPGLARFAALISDVSLSQAIASAGLTTNCKLILDAADVDSYPGTGQKWLDRSGNGYDFFRGNSASSEGADPTFTGTAGDISRSTYWAFDGGDYFTYDTTNETWMDSLHKDGAIWSALIAFQIPNLGAQAALFGTAETTNPGVNFTMDASEKLEVKAFRSGATALNVTAGTGVSQNTWHIAGLSINEPTGSGGGFLYLDGNYLQVAGNNTFDATYSSPSSSAAERPLQIGARGGDQERLANGSRLGFLAIWQGTALSKANFDTLYTALKGRYGLA